MIAPPAHRVLCCRELTSAYLDHIIPLSRGGEDAEYNLQATHPFCNQSKNAKGDLPVLNPPSQTAMKGYMTSKEAAIRLGITPSGVVMQIHRGALAAEKIGRDWVISEDEARRYLRENAGKRGTSSPRHRGTGGRPPKDRGEVS